MNNSYNTALIFGSGQVAEELSRVNQANWKIVVIPRSSVDIRCFKAVREVMEKNDCSIVINTAAFTDVEQSENCYEECFSVNRDGAANIAIAASKMNAPFIHLSTDYVFDGRKETYYCEPDRTNPLNVYGQSKLAGENEIRNLASMHIIVRTSWVFASHGKNFLTTMLKSFGKSKEVNVVDDQIGCPTPAPSIARMLLKIGQQILDGSDSWGVYHYCGYPEVSWYGLADKIFSTARSKGVIVPRLNRITTADYAGIVSRPLRVVMNCAEIKRIWNIQQPDWKNGVEECLSRALPGGHYQE